MWDVILYEVSHFNESDQQRCFGGYGQYPPHYEPMSQSCYSSHNMFNEFLGCIIMIAQPVIHAYYESKYKSNLMCVTLDRFFICQRSDLHFSINYAPKGHYIFWDCFLNLLNDSVPDIIKDSFTRDTLSDETIVDMRIDRIILPDTNTTQIVIFCDIYTNQGELLFKIEIRDIDIRPVDNSSNLVYVLNTHSTLTCTSTAGETVNTISLDSFKNATLSHVRF